ncbi:MAG TPA: hypothetical protein VGR57_11725 [Ktedonobacterales bacterium]|nr:hypothetical protein [Ktedonobacterales bacterium]
MAGICFEVVGLVAAFFGAAIRATNMRWALLIVLAALVGAAVAIVAYNWGGDQAEFVEVGFVICALGGFAYSVAGPDYTYVPVAGATGDIVVSRVE